MKVYIVTYGEYSEYAIEAVFTAKEKADEYVQFHGTEYRVEEFETDVEFEKKTKVWDITLDTQSGELAMSVPLDNTEYNLNKLDTCKKCIFGDNKMDFYVMADTQDRATKIAYERLVALKSNPFIWLQLNTKVIASEGYCYTTNEYPTFNIKTNKFYTRVPMKKESRIIEGALKNITLIGIDELKQTNKE